MTGIDDLGADSGTLASLAAILARRAAVHGDRQAFAFIPERGDRRPTLTFAELDLRARALAERLLEHAAPGDCAILLFPPGLDCVLALFACFAARIVAVPLMPPRRAGGRDSSAAVVADCTPSLLLTNRDLAAARPDAIERFGGAIRCVMVDASADAAPVAVLPEPNRADLALLQYTSGSTSSPKGVMVSHGAMLENLEMVRFEMGNSSRSTCVNWVPLYHDMGLMMGATQPVYIGALSVLMPPAGFMMRPLAWLRAISEYRAEVSSAPNFAFDLCVARHRAEQMAGVDLSCWKVAMNAAEPVHADTIASFAETFAPYGFDPAAMYPAYGLAEATLLVTAGKRSGGVLTRQVSRSWLHRGEARSPESEDDARKIVACGRAMVGQRVAIADPATLRPVPAGTVGEILAHGTNVADGYWRNPAVTEAVFGARLLGADDGATWLRTGDLGCLDDTGALFVAGRIKDLIVIRGVNHYPQDIERTVQNAHPALRPDGGAAFAIEDEHGIEKLAIVHEIDRTHRRDLDPTAVEAAIRTAVAAEHDLAVHDIALIAPATLPTTTSGKVQRGLIRQLWSEGRLERIDGRAPRNAV